MGALDERSYRRGLILGLTMAEVVTLVLFALLLIWMTGLRGSAERQTEIEKLRARIAGLETQREAVLGSAERANAFDDLFRELTAVKAKVTELESRAKARDSAVEALASLGYSFADQKSAAKSEADIRERLEIASAVIKQTGSAMSSGSVDEATLRKKVAALAEIHSALSREGLTTETFGKACADALRQKSQQTIRMSTLEGRLKNAERQLGIGGRGTEKPACWADDTGKPEYIFDVALKSRSVMMRDNALSHRQPEQAMLPISAIVFGSELTQQDFRLQTRALFEWSEKEGCRFFVRVFDETAPHEKDAYKRQLRTVGEHFYYYEELNRGWGGSIARAAP